MIQDSLTLHDWLISCALAAFLLVYSSTKLLKSISLTSSNSKVIIDRMLNLLWPIFSVFFFFYPTHLGKCQFFLFSLFLRFCSPINFTIVIHFFTPLIQVHLKTRRTQLTTHLLWILGLYLHLHMCLVMGNSINEELFTSKPNKPGQQFVSGHDLMII